MTDAILDFTDRHVFVAGGTSGINFGIARAFAGRGARTTVISRNEERVANAVATLEGDGGEAQGHSADVRDPARIEAVIATACEAYGDIDVLISGAAGNFLALAKDMSPNAFKAVVDIDLLGTFHVLRYGYARLRKPGASVINISAPQAFVAGHAQAHVSAAKAGVDMLTRSLAIEWGGDGIRVNSIVPGMIEHTEGFERLAPKGAGREKLAATVPLGRLGQADDVANLALFLASPLGDYVSGAVIPVDGGWSLQGYSLLASAAFAEAARRGRDD
jgi:NAD(P)-dependent dehydrogenase (short-subunit alcohol dehydrogenase family)